MPLGTRAQEYVGAEDMLVELFEDNRQVALSLRAAHTCCNGYGDVGSASLIENWIDEAERAERIVSYD
jgi:starvation-inducible DNA-binding protein